MRNRVPVQGGVYATASNSQTRGSLVFTVSGQGCADLGHRVSNPVQADRENSQTPQTVVIAHGSAVYTQRYIGASARHHAQVMRLREISQTPEPLVIAGEDLCTVIGYSDAVINK